MNFKTIIKYILLIFLINSEFALGFQIENITDYFQDESFFSERLKDTKIKYIINHYTGSNSLEKTLSDLKKSKNSTHYIIDHDGRIFQMIDDSKKAHHVGSSAFGPDFGLNESSIGIEHVNFGFLEAKNQILKEERVCLIFEPKHKEFLSKCKNYKKIFAKNLDGILLKDKKKILEKSHKKFFFTKFSEAQIESSIKLNQFLMKKHNIKPSDVLGHSDVSLPYLRKVDPGPMFLWEVFAERGIGAWANDKDLQSLNLKILKESKKKQKEWFVKKLIEFGFHDPIYSKYNSKKAVYEKFDLKIHSHQYLKEIQRMITVYNLHFRPEKGISDEIDQKDLKIIYVLNLKKQGK